MSYYRTAGKALARQRHVVIFRARTRFASRHRAILITSCTSMRRTRRNYDQSSPLAGVGSLLRTGGVGGLSARVRCYRR